MHKRTRILGSTAGVLALAVAVVCGTGCKRAEAPNEIEAPTVQAAPSVPAATSPPAPPPPVSVSASSEKTRPNILFVIVDTLRADRIEAARNGTPVMPRTRRFAADVWNFTNAQSQESWTKPSVASIFTSLYPATHGVQYGARHSPAGTDPQTDALPEDFASLATLLRAAGYATLGVQTNPNLDKTTGFDQGFDEYRLFKFAPAPIITSQAIDIAKPFLAGNGSPAAPQNKDARPLFLYAHYIDPHVPYIVPKARANLFGGPPPVTPEDMEMVKRQEDYHDDFIAFMTGLAPAKKLPYLSLQGRDYMRFAYDVECDLIDQEFAALLAGLAPLLQNAIIVFVADHGEEFWEHNGIGHGRTVYQELVHVPMMMQLPGYPAKRDDLPVQTIDILPTLAAYLGLPADLRWQGRSLIEGKRGNGEKGKREDQDPNTAAQFSQAHGTFKGTKVNWSCVKVGSMKLIQSDATGEVELYDLARDPSEKENLATRDAATAARLTALLKTQKEACTKAHDIVPHRTVPLTPEMQETLRSIGYLGH